MLQVSGISKIFGDDVVLNDVSFTLAPGARSGLVGANGTGKTTLLRIIAGELAPSAGSVSMQPRGSIAYLPQATVAPIDMLSREWLHAMSGRVGQLHDELQALETSLQAADGEKLSELLQRYAAVTQEFEALDGYSLSARIDRIAAGLGLGALDLQTPVRSLSGGNRTKLSLARLLLQDAQLNVLDEPTNFLDMPALLWLESFITASARSFLIVSHDRRFLDRTVSTILELSPETRSLRIWAGNFTAYAEAREAERQRETAAYRDQQERIARVERDIRTTRDQARGVEAHAKSGMGADHQRRLAKKVARKAKVRERRLERELEEQRIEKPALTWGLHLTDLEKAQSHADKCILRVEDVSVSYGARTVLRGVDLSLYGKDRVALLGTNGAGKSTVLRCITGRIPYVGTVRLGAGVRPGFLMQDSEDLPLDMPVLDLFRARVSVSEEEARTYPHKFLFAGGEVFKTARALSYGQRSKLALAVMLASEANFLLLDEPTAHMDIPALSAIEEALAAYAGPLLVVSHDRYFIERINVTRIVALRDGRVIEMDSMEMYERSLMTP